MRFQLARRTFQRGAFVALASALTGCFNTQSQIIERFVLSNQSPRAVTTTPQSPARFRIALGTVIAPRYLDSQKIVYRSQDSQIGAYLFSSWAETPPRQLHTLLLDKLEQQKTFLSVSRIATGSVADLQLNTELRDFSYRNREKQVVVSLTAELVDLRSHTVVGRENFQESATVSNENVGAVVEELNNAANVVTERIATWTGEQSEKLP